MIDCSDTEAVHAPGLPTGARVRIPERSEPAGDQHHIQSGNPLASLPESQSEQHILPGQDAIGSGDPAVRGREEPGGGGRVLPAAAAGHRPLQFGHVDGAVETRIPALVDGDERADRLSIDVGGQQRPEDDPVGRVQHRAEHVRNDRPPAQTFGQRSEDDGLAG